MEYLVSHGLSGTIGRYRAAEALTLPRGTAVVVRSERGLELGEVVRPASPRHAGLSATVGQLVRRVGADDEAQAQAMAARAAQVLLRAEELATKLGLALTVLDAEVLLEGMQGTLLHVRRGECDVRELVRPLAVEFDLSLALLDRTAEEHASGCGSCGSGGCGSCGSGGGGCGSGSCSSASVAEVREYFAQLRTRMESGRVPLL